MRCALALISAALAPAVASAQGRDEAPARDPLFMLSEPARIVDVIDSADDGSAFSFRLTAGYLFQRRTATIEREQRVSDPTSGMGTTQFNRVGDYVENTHTLMLNAQLGIFHDFALTFGVPLVLQNSREIRSLTSPGAMEGNNALADGWTQDGRATSLFSVPFRAPDRAGIDQVRLGLSWSILNQQRDRTKPTWSLHFEWRPPVGDTMRACNAAPTPGTAECPAGNSLPNLPAGTVAATGAANRPLSGGAAGISRGVHGVYFQTAVARRVGFIEPYAALDILAEFPLRSTTFRYFDTPYGQLASYPPITSSLVVGAELIPWENRESWQRFTIDLRFRGTYRSQGRDYSPLYDALGSSTSRALALPGCPSNVRNADGTCQPGREVYFDGLTTNAAYVVINSQLTLALQPAKFVRIDLGLGVSWLSPHMLTVTDACNPGETVPAAHPEWRGGCVNDSAPDPTHRVVIDQPGGRFRTTGDTQVDFFANVSFTPRFF
jgi:hypothetical protein